MSRQKILVVDDSWTELTLITTTLTRNGFEVVTAIDGDEVFEKVVVEHPSCIIIDVVLPKQSGFQVCRKLKRIQGYSHIPIILLTQKSMPLDQAWGLRQGADLYMTKPFRDEDLVASVRRLLS